ncbi:phosphate propanoyltransferase [Clostridium sporogenes]|uniref:Phosphate propanoyltransferase n=2 Tax=Clostridium TaxID=1485 RepID=A0A6M0SXI4_CLOBO|nr:ethanolamine utilization phosphate acetyltransferase EutD [Clostridium sporogenes]NFA60218.1 phosphate propanoyltransferase [Clostridium botulinum]MDS1002324.1 ethanolamine utilization phosphate acetyltransferase EutD [Clostridium sporogenes]NFI72807.1 phosphate propanoyltransferase [Clostridium sporogenes]NFL72406.1 phosphate propanoyltransferase [Clostridium sporogenes]NFM23419.1 phosphate propanoyltransferase [Clostridium sporogenes]
MDNLLLETLVKEVVERVKEEAFVEVEASGRHVHLSRKDINLLFGEGYELTNIKDLSQPGQYACKERVTLVGPKGTISNVVVLGPERKETQVEVSLTDALALGIKAPVKESADIEGTPSIIIFAGNKVIQKDKGVIVAKRHIHMTPEDAKKFNVSDKEIVKVKVFTQRPLIFDDVIIRVSKKFKTYMHIDYDEANACGFSKGTLAKIIK